MYLENLDSGPQSLFSSDFIDFVLFLTCVPSKRYRPRLLPFAVHRSLCPSSTVGRSSVPGTSGRRGFLVLRRLLDLSGRTFKEGSRKSVLEPIVKLKSKHYGSRLSVGST